jgi:hypothetical protein
VGGCKSTAPCHKTQPSINFYVAVVQEVKLFSANHASLSTARQKFLDSAAALQALPTDGAGEYGFDIE